MSRDTTAAERAAQSALRLAEHELFQLAPPGEGGERLRQAVHARPPAGPLAPRAACARAGCSRAGSARPTTRRPRSRRDPRPLPGHADGDRREAHARDIRTTARTPARQPRWLRDACPARAGQPALRSAGARRPRRGGAPRAARAPGGPVERPPCRGALAPSRPRAWTRRAPGGSPRRPTRAHELRRPRRPTRPPRRSRPPRRPTRRAPAERAVTAASATLRARGGPHRVRRGRRPMVARERRRSRARACGGSSSTLPPTFPEPFPGQFVMVAPRAARAARAAARAAVLDRARGAHARRGWTLGILYTRVGRGTDLMRAPRRGAWSVLGPLGRGFRADTKGPALLVGGGRGTAPLVLPRRVARGARTPRASSWSARAAVPTGPVPRRWAPTLARSRVWAATEDGSRGLKGRVLELFAREPALAEALARTGRAHPRLRAARPARGGRRAGRGLRRAGRRLDRGAHGVRHRHLPLVHGAARARRPEAAQGPEPRVPRVLPRGSGRAAPRASTGRATATRPCHAYGRWTRRSRQSRDRRCDRPLGPDRRADAGGPDPRRLRHVRLRRRVRRALRARARWAASSPRRSRSSRARATRRTASSRRRRAC